MASGANAGQSGRNSLAWFDSVRRTGSTLLLLNAVLIDNNGQSTARDNKPLLRRRRAGHLRTAKITGLPVGSATRTCRIVNATAEQNFVIRESARQALGDFRECQEDMALQIGSVSVSLMPALS